MNDEGPPIGTASGDAAAPGEDGAAGASGRTGAAGPSGAPGPSRAPGPSGAAGPSGPAARIEVLDRDGRARHALSVAAWPLAIGRAIDNDVVLDDPHVAPYHAVIEAGPGGAPQLRVLPGRNGMRCGRRTLPAGGEPVPLHALATPAASSAAGATTVAGATTAAGTTAAATAAGPGGAIELTAGLTRLRLRLRQAGDALEPERELVAPGSAHAGTLVLALLLWMWILAEHAIGLDPGSKASDWLPPLLGAPLALAGWCLMWALASKIFQHRFEFWPHVAVAVRGLLVVEVVSFALVWLSGVSGWPGFGRVITGATAAVGVVTLWAHARLVLPHQQRALAYASAAAYLAGTAILLALNQQRNERWFAELYAHMLPPPALMWQAPTARETFVKRAEQLRPALEKSSAEAAAEQKEKGDDAEEE